MVKYEDIEEEKDENKKNQEDSVFEPNVTYVVKNNHKVLKNTLFYLSVAILFVLNFVFILDMTSTKFTSTIAQGVRDIFSSNQTTTQSTSQTSSFIDVNFYE